MDGIEAARKRDSIRHFESSVKIAEQLTKSRYPRSRSDLMASTGLKEGDFNQGMGPFSQNELVTVTQRENEPWYAVNEERRAIIEDATKLGVPRKQS